MKGALSSFDGVAMFCLSDFSAKTPATAAVIRIKDEAIAKDIFQAAKLKDAGDDHYTYDEGETHIDVVWLKKPRLIVVGPRGQGAVEAALDVIAGKKPSFAKGDILKNAKRGAGEAFVYADLHRLVGKFTDALGDGSAVFARLGADFSDVHLTLLGPLMPHIGSLLAPVPHDAIGKLPGAPSVALELTHARVGGKTVTDFLDEVGRVQGKPSLAADADKALGQMKAPSLTDIDRMIGDALTVGMYYPTLPTAGDPESMQRGTIIGTLGLHDDKIARSVFDTVKKLAGDKDAVWGDGKLTAEEPGGGRAFELELKKDQVVVGFGEKTDVEKRLADLESGASTFDKAPAYAGFAKKSVPSQLSIYVDPAILTAMIPKEQQGIIDWKSLSTDVVLAPSDQGLDVSLKGSSGGTAMLIGTLSAVAIYGVRSYLASAKSAEAKNTIGAIARGAQASFERESTDASGKLVHALCPTAKPTLDGVPHATKGLPDPKLFESDPGWKCLRFALS